MPEKLTSVSTSGGDLLSSHAAGTVSGNEFSQVIAIWAIAAKRLGVKQSLDATVGTYSIGIVIIVPRRPTQWVCQHPRRRTTAAVPTPAAAMLRGQAQRQNLPRDTSKPPNPRSLFHSR